MAVADDAYRVSVQVNRLPGSHSIEGREHIIHHAPSITAGCILDAYAMSAAIIQVYMACDDGVCSYEFHRRAFQQAGIALSPGADYHSIGIFYYFARDFVAGNIFHFGKWLEDAFHERHFIVYDYSFPASHVSI